MRELVRLFTQIALLRRGPQDLPASTLLLVLTIVAYLVVNLLMTAIAPPLDGSAATKAAEADLYWIVPAQLLLDVAFTLVWYVVLLRLAHRSERTLQTSTAVFGFKVVLTPFLFVPSWLLSVGGDPDWALPSQLFGIIVVGWIIVVNSFIVKAALEWSNGASVALAILQLSLQIIVILLLSRAMLYSLQG